MRLIKFKAKRRDNGEWVEGYFFETPLTDEATSSIPEDGWFFLTGIHRDCISRNGAVYEISRESLCEYTGLKDKNGVEIWEGDIVRTKYANARINEFTELVVYRNGKFMAERKFGTASTAWALLSDGVMHIAEDKSVYMQEIEVIGNVFDNPELLNT